MRSVARSKGDPERYLLFPRRQLHDPTSVLWFVIATVVFIGLGLVFKSRLLNWFVGPLFPVLFLHILPAAARRGYRWVTRPRVTTVNQIRP